MNERRNTTGFDRRTFLAGAAAACLAGAARAQENDPLQELIQRNQEEKFGQTFDAAANSNAAMTRCFIISSLWVCSFAGPRASRPR